MNTEEGSSEAVLCKNGCGFFSGSDTNGLCSFCFKDSLKKETDGSKEKKEITPSLISENETKATASPSTQIPEKVESSELSETSLEEKTEDNSKPESTEEESISEPQRKRKRKCFSCKKKLGLTGFPCRCGGLFCGVHRYSDKHECDFDYKALGEREISENNSLVIAEKIRKI